MELVHELRRILGAEACLAADAELFAYECDGLTLHSGRPLAVVLPRSVVEVHVSLKIYAVVWSIRGMNWLC